MIKKIKNIFYVKDREEKREINKQLLITVVSVFITVISVIGVSFAAFVWGDNSEKEQKIAVGNLDLVISSDSAPLGSGLNYPVNDTDVDSLEPYTFTVTNNGSLAANYTLKLVDDIDAITSDGCADNQINKNYVYGNVRGDVTVSNTSLTDLIATSIDTGVLLPGQSKTYNLRLWIHQTAPNSVIGGHFHGKIQLEIFSMDEMILPTEYQQVEYIESTGTQYINTGYVDVSETLVELDFAYTGKTISDNACYAGANGGNIIAVRVDNSISLNATNTNILASEGARYKITSYRDVNDNRSGTINGVEFIGTKASKNEIYHIFTLGGQPTANQRIYGKLYSCKIYYQDVIVRDLVPCYRKSDNIAGLYDIVNNVFYTNEGTGEFVVGKDIFYW